MAWLAAIGGGAAAGGAATGAAAGSTAAGTAAGAAGSTAASAGIGEAIKGAATDVAKDAVKDAAVNTVSQAAQSGDPQTNNAPGFTGAQISSDENNKIIGATFEKHDYKKPDNTSEIGKAAKGLIDGAESLVSSSEDLKANKSDVSSEEEDDTKKTGAAALLNSEISKMGKDILSNVIANAANSQPMQPVQAGFTGAQISSDEELKTDINNAGGLVPLFAQIDSYLYKYKPEAQEEYAGTGMMNNDNNLGVMAQELQENPLTEPAVKTDEKGNLALDTGRLTSINTAMIAELCKKVQAIEEQMYGRAQ